MRKSTMLSNLLPNQTFYWKDNMNFSGQFLKKSNNGFLVVTSGTDGNTKNVQLYPDTTVWIGSDEPRFTEGKSILDIRNNTIVAIQEIIKEGDDILYRGFCIKDDELSETIVPDKYAILPEDKIA